MFDSLIRDLRYQLARNNPVVRIILINVAVFILLNLLVRLILLISGYSGLMLELKFRALVSWLAFPFSLSEFIVKPWTLITSLFVHEGFFHIFWNLVILFWFGQIFTDVVRNKFYFTYFGGGIFATLFAFAGYSLFPGLFSAGYAYQLIGASGAITAIMLAAATMVPEFRMNLLFIGPVKLKYIALVVLVLDLISVTYQSNTGGHLAHIGGGLFGFLFAFSLKNGTDWTTLIKFKKKTHLKTVHRNRSLSPREIQQRIDEILDKINRSGYDSLSKDEKEDWFKYHDKV
jgi:membrane associated rhomboid family serine protease